MTETKESETGREHILKRTHSMENTFYRMTETKEVSQVENIF